MNEFVAKIAGAIQDPEGRILMRYIGPHAHLLKAEFKGYNKRIAWDEGYSCVKVRIETALSDTEEQLFAQIRISKKYWDALDEIREKARAALE